MTANDIASQPGDNVTHISKRTRGLRDQTLRDAGLPLPPKGGADGYLSYAEGYLHGFRLECREMAAMAAIGELSDKRRAGLVKAVFKVFAAIGAASDFPENAARTGQMADEAAEYVAQIGRGAGRRRGRRRRGRR